MDKVEIGVLKDGKGVIVFSAKSNVTEVIKQMQSGNKSKSEIFELGVQALELTLESEKAVGVKMHDYCSKCGKQELYAKALGSVVTETCKACGHETDMF